MSTIINYNPVITHVVEAYHCPGGCHTVCVARQFETSWPRETQQAWYYFFARNNTGASVPDFGDRVLIDVVHGAFHLWRGPGLLFRIPVDPIDDALVARLTLQSPDLVEDGDFPEINFFPH